MPGLGQDGRKCQTSQHPAGNGEGKSRNEMDSLAFNRARDELRAGISRFSWICCRRNRCGHLEELHEHPVRLLGPVSLGLASRQSDAGWDRDYSLSPPTGDGQVALSGFMNVIGGSSPDGRQTLEEFVTAHRRIITELYGKKHTTSRGRQIIPRHSGDSRQSNSPSPIAATPIPRCEKSTLCRWGETKAGGSG